MSRASKKHSSGFHDDETNGTSKINGGSSSESEDYGPFQSKHTQYEKVEPSPPPIVTISIDDSDDELDNNNEESSPDRHRRAFEVEEELQDSNETVKRSETDDSDNEVEETFDEIESISKITSNGKKVKNSSSLKFYSLF